MDKKTTTTHTTPETVLDAPTQPHTAIVTPKQNNTLVITIVSGILACAICLFAGIAIGKGMNSTTSATMQSPGGFSGQMPQQGGFGGPGGMPGQQSTSSSGTTQQQSSSSSTSQTQ